MISIKFVLPKNFSSMKNDWKSLEQGSDMTAFQTYDWYEKLNRLYLCKGTMRGICVYILAYEDDIIKMIAPIHVRKLNLSFKGSGIEKGIYIFGKWTYSDYLNFIYKDFSSDCFSAIIKAASEKYREKNVFLHQILPETDMYKYINKTYPESKVIDGGCARIIPCADFDKYYSGLSKNARQNIRTAHNRSVKDNCPISFSVLNNISESEAQDFFNIYLKRRKSKNSHIGFPKNKSDLLSLFQTLINDMQFNRINKYNYIIDSMQNLKSSFILAIYSGENKVGFCFGLRDKSAIRIPIVCFLDEYARYSPGVSAIFGYIKSTYEQNCPCTFDLLKGTEKYKTDLGAQVFNIGYFKIII